MSRTSARADAVKGMSKSAGKVKTLLLVSKILVSVDERSFWMYVARAPGSIND